MNLSNNAVAFGAPGIELLWTSGAKEGVDLLLVLVHDYEDEKTKAAAPSSKRLRSQNAAENRTVIFQRIGTQTSKWNE
jgi:hypothetical protein